MQNYPPKLQFNFLIKISNSVQETKLTKLAPILNQLNIEGSSQLDEMLHMFFVDFAKATKLRNFSSNLLFTLWVNKESHNFYEITPLNLEFFFKNFSEKVNFSINKKDFLFKKKLFQLFSLFFVQSTKFNSDFDFLLQLNRYKETLLNYCGHLYSYSARKKMLGRKTNFRYKTKKKKFEDY